MSTGMLVLTPKALENAIYLHGKLMKDNDKLNGYNEKLNNYNERSNNKKYNKKLNNWFFIYAPLKLERYQKLDHAINIIFYDISFSKIVEEAFLKHDELIFIMACGIVVRSIAPYLKDKVADPAVVVMDEELEFCISLVGGHIAGANELCKKISLISGSTGVITTSTDVNQKGALDIIAKRLSDYKNEQRDLYKKINYKLTCSEKIFIISDFDVLKSRLDIRGFTLLLAEDAWDKEEDIIHLKAADKNSDVMDKVKQKPNYHPIYANDLVLGIGCRKDTSFEQIKQGFDEFIKEYNINPDFITAIASIDLKKNEHGIIELAKYLNAEFITYTADEINAAIEKMQNQNQKITGSEFVKRITGALAIAEPSCYIASKGNLAVNKQIKNKVTFSLSVNIKN